MIAENITAICGWAVPPVWFADRIRSVFPRSKVNAVYPLDPFDEREAEQILRRISEKDGVIAHSMGTLWLLHHKKYLAASSHRILLSPILAFTRERGMGGKVASVQLQFLKRSVSRESAGPFPYADFYKMCNLHIAEEQLKTLPDRHTLVKGLEFLESIAVSAGKADDCQLILGESDPLLDGATLKKSLPHLQLVNDAGHNPEPLLAYLASLS